MATTMSLTCTQIYKPLIKKYCNTKRSLPFLKQVVFPISRVGTDYTCLWSVLDGHVALIIANKSDEQSSFYKKNFILKNELIKKLY